MSKLNLNPDWLIPDWPAPPHVHAVCTTRAGGCSVSPYDSFNLGDHVGDDPNCVAANRRDLGQSIDARPVFLSQVHGSEVASLSFHSQDGTVADAAQTSEKGLACTVMVADCLPVLFTNRGGSMVCAAHAGWRGLAGQAGQGVLETVVERFRALPHDQYGSNAIDIIAWLGPCIGPEAFEVGDEVRNTFMANDVASENLFIATSHGKWLANLPGLARQRLAKLGVTKVYGNDGSQTWCTASNPSRFFSYRRDGISGRFAASVWLS